MFDRNKPGDRIIEATMALAAEKPWSEISLAEIAEKAEVPLADLRQHFCAKSAILAAFVRAVDDEVLRRTSRTKDLAKHDESPRERLFDVVMTRFDVLGPHKPALRRMLGREGRPALVCLSPAQFLASQRWMLAAAGVSTDGPLGALRVSGLAAAYADAFWTWLDDDDPGLAKTMARLDRRLGRGERWLRRAGDFCAALERLACCFCPPQRRQREAAGERHEAATVETSEGGSRAPDESPGKSPGEAGGSEDSNGTSGPGPGPGPAPQPA